MFTDSQGSSLDTSSTSLTRRVPPGMNRGATMTQLAESQEQLGELQLDSCKNEEEVVVVIAHELGHWKLNHTMYFFIVVQVC
uniref:Peptidase M48 domain-containing protein n=1 Tax=Lactuca sativa TaxID=4236 RepID=A0A9R1UU70_LACSA|nr:hypothetical protein LSAT_V11C800412600 [Lactuca sativa]